MLTIREHEVNDYAVLRDMDATAVGMLTEDDRACLDALGKYLVGTGSWQRFAIWLLHKHFEPEPGEVSYSQLLERGAEAPPNSYRLTEQQRSLEAGVD